MRVAAHARQQLRAGSRLRGNRRRGDDEDKCGGERGCVHGGDLQAIVGAAADLEKSRHARAQRAGALADAQARRPGTASDGGRRRHDVVEFDAAGRALEHQRAAAHVAAPDEVRRKVQPRAERVGQHVDVLRRRDAAQQHHARLGWKGRGQRARIGHQRLEIPRLVVRHIDGRKLLDQRTRDRQVRALQAPGRRDDAGRVSAVGATAKRARIGDLAAEVQAAHERERLAQRERPGIESLGERHRRPRPHEQPRTTAAAVGRREQKDRGPGFGAHVVHPTRRRVAMFKSAVFTVPLRAARLPLKDPRILGILGISCSKLLLHCRQRLSRTRGGPVIAEPERPAA